MIPHALQKILGKPCCLLLVLALACVLAGRAAARMQSDSVQLNTSVLSGGGAPPSSSTRFNLQGTTGQASPLMDPDDPPGSAFHTLYPGFWYTLDAIPAVCDDALAFAAAFGSLTGDGNYNAACDLEGDGDVDGEDLAGLAAGL